MVNVNRFWHKYALTKYSFGSTSALITNLALITGLDSASNAKLSIIGALLVIAVADNISDSLGIHIYKESESFKAKEVWISTLTYFFSRLFVSLVFILFVAFLPLQTAVILSIAFGLLVLATISYAIAKNEGKNVYFTIVEHFFIASLVIALSSFLGHWLVKYF